MLKLYEIIGSHFINSYGYDDNVYPKIVSPSFIKTNNVDTKLYLNSISKVYSARSYWHNQPLHIEFKKSSPYHVMSYWTVVK